MIHNVQHSVVPISVERPVHRTRLWRMQFWSTKFVLFNRIFPGRAGVTKIWSAVRCWIWVVVFTYNFQECSVIIVMRAVPSLFSLWYGLCRHRFRHVSQTSNVIRNVARCSSMCIEETRNAGGCHATRWKIRHCRTWWVRVLATLWYSSTQQLMRLRCAEAAREPFVDFTHLMDVREREY